MPALPRPLWAACAPAVSTSHPGTPPRRGTGPSLARVIPVAHLMDATGRGPVGLGGARSDPVACTDATGAVVGLLRVEDLAAAAARR